MFSANIKSFMLLGLFLLIAKALSAQFNYIKALNHTGGEHVHDLERGPEKGSLILYQDSPSTSVLLSVDSLGNSNWARSLPGVYEELMVANDGHLFLMEPNMENVKLAKLTASGDSVWQFSYPLFVNSFRGFYADITPQGNVILGGSETPLLFGVNNKLVMVDRFPGTSLAWILQQTFCSVSSF